MPLAPLVWAVPVVAAVAALIVLMTQARKLEELSVGLARDVRRLRELGRPLRAVRQELDRSGPLVGNVWSHWHERAVEAEDPGHL